MITLYLGKRTIVINAYIKRNPDGLGQWLVMSDNAQAHEQLEGRFV